VQERIVPLDVALLKPEWVPRADTLEQLARVVAQAAPRPAVEHDRLHRRLRSPLA